MLLLALGVRRGKACDPLPGSVRRTRLPDTRTATHANRLDDPNAELRLSRRRELLVPPAHVRDRAPLDPRYFGRSHPRPSTVPRKARARIDLYRRRPRPP